MVNIKYYSKYTHTHRREIRYMGVNFYIRTDNDRRM